MKNKPYSEIIKWRIRGGWFLLILIIAYCIVITELGGGDSRIMTPLAETVSDLIIFGSMIYIGCRIYHNKKLLKYRLKMKESFLTERDERNRYLHDKSGGVVVDLLLIILLFVTTTTALFDMSAFYTSYAILLAAIVLKGLIWFLYYRDIL